MILNKAVNKTALHVSLCLFGMTCTYGAWASDNTVQLEQMYVEIGKKAPQAKPLGGVSAVSETTIQAQTLKQRGSNLGDALADELGIHASQFGGGSSAPVIRGQEGKRIKILSGGSETMDMSAMSPDHAVTVDSMLAKEIELVRGADTLLYASGNSAGVVNVVDNKIPSEMVDGIEGEAGLRLGSADNERLVNFAISGALGQNIVLHAEGLYKKTDDYHTPNYILQNQRHDKLDNSFAKNQSVSAGASWIGDKGFLGMAYSEREDKYGLPAHSHLYENYYLHVLLTENFWVKPYLRHYPFLMDENDIDYNNPGIDCITKQWHQHGHLCGHGHSHGANETHASHDNPHIALTSKRWDVRGQLNEVGFGIDKIRLNAGKADYHHDEKTGSVVDNTFKNKAHNVRVELLHQPIGRLSGVFGWQQLYQDSYALDNHALGYRRQHLLHDHKSRQNSFFILERLSWQKAHWDFSARAERQSIAMQYNLLDVPEDETPPEELTKPHKSTAYSYATSFYWKPKSKHQLSLTLSHQERLPNAQELYAHGKHLATNAFEVGNKNLAKERSNNLELGWAFTGDKLNAKLSTYYNKFDNYIYAAILNDKTCFNGRCSRSLTDEYSLRLYRYNQAKADIYGVEGEIGYQFSPIYYVSLFGDYVRGKLKDLPELPTGYRYQYDAQGNRSIVPIGYQKQPDGDAPRMPAMRLGVSVKADFTPYLTGSARLYHSFKQDKVARLEQPTQGHTMLNLGLTYEGVYADKEYSIFANVNNALNQKIYNHSSFLSYIPQSGRSLSVGMNVKF